MKTKSRRPNRDTVTTINADGSKLNLHPADVRGPFTLLRRISAYLLIVIYVSLPWIQVNGHPAVFLDAVHRRFHFFGITLAAQDMWLFFFLITGLGFFLFYITALLGRLWCGWACPQTVFLEHVFRKIERLLEGDAQARRKLDAAPWDSTKVMRRGLKHGIFILLSLVIAHLFASYFISLPTLYGYMKEAPTAHISTFMFIVVFAGILYFNFVWFREQLCIVICPYGRLQSALIDNDSLVIGYDGERGEPRGKPSEEGAGDCIDCNRCVQVCPTGIDIRQGLQMECIGCAACIDACDEIMEKVKRPKGLVRYDSLNGLEGKKRRWLRPRIFLYTALLLVGASVMTASFSSVKSAIVTAVRMQGSPYYLADGVVRNQFLLRVINKRNEERTFEMRLDADELPAEGFKVLGMDEGAVLEGMGEKVYTVVMTMEAGHFNGKFTVPVHVTDASGSEEWTTLFEFLGPDPDLLRESLAD